MASKIGSRPVLTFLVTSLAYWAEVHPVSAETNLPPTSMESTETQSTFSAQSLGRADFGAVAGRSVLDSKSLQVDRTFLAATIGWLSQNFGFPQIDKLPNIAFVTDDALPTLLNGQRSGWLDVEGLYLASNRTIYLPVGWSGSSPREVSILVHELVHYLQHQSGVKFACAEELEKQAYKAQQAWLALFDRDLFKEFATDPFTLLVRTQCPM
jgi:Domain of unknown function (DUF6647)